MSNPFRVGQKLTLIGCSEMAVSYRREITVKQALSEPDFIRSGTGRTRYGTFSERGKRKEFYLEVRHGSTIILDGWNLPIRVDSEGGSFRGNALLNLVGDVETIRGLIDAALVIDDEAKSHCVVWGEHRVDERLPGVRAIMPSDEFTILYRELAEASRHAVMQRLIGELAEKEAAVAAEVAACPDCNAGPTGPVPAYCQEHDGDYSSWLARNNID